MITKKHFQEIAKVIANLYMLKEYDRLKVINGLAEYFKRENPRFDYDKFYKECVNRTL